MPSPLASPELLAGFLVAAPAVIFDSAIYENEVLLLPPGQTEDVLDDELATAARELGVSHSNHHLFLDVHDVSTAISTLTVSSEHRSSISVRSHSTGVTSNPSRTSKDHFIHDRPSIGLTALPARPSYDLVLKSIHPRISHSRSSSTASSSSVKRLHLAAKKLGFRSGRGHLHYIFRKDTRPISQCITNDHDSKPPVSGPRTSASQQNQSATLSCGHSLSKSSIRAHVREATSTDCYLPPTCCGSPIPGAVLETVMSKAEMDELVRGLVQTYGLEIEEFGSRDASDNVTEIGKRGIYLVSLRKM